jgi:hypothetical protein
MAHTVLTNPGPSIEVVGNFQEMKTRKFILNQSYRWVLLAWRNFSGWLSNFEIRESFPPYSSSPKALKFSALKVHVYWGEQWLI